MSSQEQNQLMCFSLKLLEKQRLTLLTLQIDNRSWGSRAAAARTNIIFFTFSVKISPKPQIRYKKFLRTDKVPISEFIILKYKVYYIPCL